MLKVESQRTKHREAEPGTDSGIFLEGSEEIECEAAHRQEVYDWVTQTIGQQEYWKQKRPVKGMLRTSEDYGLEPGASGAAPTAV